MLSLPLMNVLYAYLDHYGEIKVHFISKWTMKEIGGPNVESTTNHAAGLANILKSRF